MTKLEAKEILLLYRPGTVDAEDPEVVEAVALARRDPELAEWFEQHCIFQETIRARLREISVPLHLRPIIPEQPRYVMWPVVRRSFLWLSAAAACLVLAGGAVLMFRPVSSNDFANFQLRVVSSALRDYRMDVRTNDMQGLRGYLGNKGAPADYNLTSGLARLSLTGGGVLHWRSNPISMVCFDRGDNQMLFLFVLKRGALKDPPGEKPTVSKMHNQVCIRWSKGEDTYLLAGPDEPDFLKKYF